RSPPASTVPLTAGQHGPAYRRDAKGAGPKMSVMAGENLFACTSCRSVYYLKRSQATIEKQCPNCGRSTHVLIDG
ncbi:MAG: hypothetical protein ABEI31_01510, partial [Halodesulfurarchaeum sp.]